MGGLLSALLPEIYIQKYETKNIINNSIYSPYIKTYFRNDDDTSILCRGSSNR